MPIPMATAEANISVLNIISLSPLFEDRERRTPDLLSGCRPERGLFLIHSGEEIGPDPIMCRAAAGPRRTYGDWVQGNSG